jgi:hypothetical protein
MPQAQRHTSLDFGELPELMEIQQGRPDADWLSRR